MRSRVSRAFTLVEILIVVVILGILAAIVVPQFTNASADAQVGNVETQLQTIRSQVELYRVRNNGQYPFGATPDWSNLVGSDYMRAAPVNPRTGTSSIAAGTAPTAELTGITSATAGWLWDATTGTIYANGFNEDFRANRAGGQTGAAADPWFRAN